MAKILIADDHPALLAAAGRLLREAGHLVTSTNNGADVLCLLTRKPPHDLIVLDLGMPALDGYEVLRALGPSAPPVLVISGGEIDQARLDVRKVKRVLEKPFTLETFLEKVAECLIDSCKDLLDYGVGEVDSKQYPLAEEWRKALDKVRQFHNV